MDYIKIKSDVLIIGGGAAGLSAAIAAAKNKAHVVVMDKGKIERSGDIGGGVDHFAAFLNEGESWDTREGFILNAWRVGKGTFDPVVFDAAFCSEMTEAVNLMGQIGVPLTELDGTYYRKKSMGSIGAYAINFNGKKFKPCIAAEVRKLGCKVLDKVMAINLIVQDGVVAGATAFSIRTGQFYVVQAKATIAATGNTNRLYENPRLSPFNSWLSPFDTGDAQRMAFKAGAALTNMEYMRMTLMPKGFGTAGLGAMMQIGGRLVNSLGEYYMEKYHHQGNCAPRNMLVYYTERELREGRGPIFVDCTHLSDADLSRLNATLGWDKDTLPDYMEQRGEDLRKKPLEIGLSEGMQAGPTERTGSGIKIDVNSASTVPGLFAAGDCADHNRCLSGAVAGGLHAGKAAADYALRTSYTRIDDNKVKEEEKTFNAPISRKEGFTYREVEQSIQKIMSENVGSVRKRIGLETAVAKLKRIRECLSLLKAKDYHELMRVHETASVFEVAEIMAHTALYREESRNIPYHYRVDFPETDDVNWCGLVVCKNQNGKITVSFQKVKL